MHILSRRESNYRVSLWKSSTLTPCIVFFTTDLLHQHSWQALAWCLKCTNLSETSLKMYSELLQHGGSACLIRTPSGDDIRCIWRFPEMQRRSFFLSGCLTWDCNDARQMNSMSSVLKYLSTASFLNIKSGVAPVGFQPGGKHRHHVEVVVLVLFVHEVGELKVDLHCTSWKRKVWNLNLNSFDVCLPITALRDA